jgi:hypothetical protein
MNVRKLALGGAVVAIILPAAAIAATTIYTGTVASIDATYYEWEDSSGPYSYSTTYPAGQAYTINVGPDSFSVSLDGADFYDVGQYSVYDNGLTATAANGDYGSGGYDNFNALVSASNTGKTMISGYMIFDSGYGDGGEYSAEDVITYDLSGPGRVMEPGLVPEPAVWAMMLIGIGGLGATLRDKRRRFGTKQILQAPKRWPGPNWRRFSATPGGKSTLAGGRDGLAI